MFPAITCSPPKRLTPRILGPESRPLREAPCPFLCAMVRRPLGRDAGDLHRGEELAMPVLAAVAFPATVLVDEELLALAAGDQHFAGHLGAGERGGADLDVGAVGDQEHLIERHRAPIPGA